MANAFQQNAFQNSPAFQTTGAVVVVTPSGGRNSTRPSMAGRFIRYRTRTRWLVWLLVIGVLHVAG